MKRRSIVRGFFYVVKSGKGEKQNNIRCPKIENNIPMEYDKVVRPFGKGRLGGIYWY
jgi:hypothetical protein